MPYSLNNIPNYISNIPIGAQKLFIAAFNSAYKNNGGNEEASRIAGWSNVKRRYKKINGKWVKKTLSINLLGIVNKVNDLPDDVKELPGDLSKVWKFIYNKKVSDDEPIVLARKEAWKIIKKYVYQDKIGNWKIKNSCSPEKIIMNIVGRKSKLKPIIKFYDSVTGNRAMFKMMVPISQLEEVDGEFFLKGIASENIIDRQDDYVEPSFIKKMKEVASTLNVYTDHILDMDHIIGKIDSTVDTDDNIFIPVTKLENPIENPLVDRLIKRLKKGMTFGYSIGGFINKAAKVFHKDVGKYIRHLIDGEIYELSVVPVPALPNSSISLTTKGLNDNSFKAIETNELDKTYLDFVKTNKIDNKMEEVKDKDENFWLFFEKAIDYFSDLSKEQVIVNKLDENDFDDKCYVIAKSGNRYPIRYIDGDKRRLHFGLLDESFVDSFINGDKDVTKQIIDYREKIGIKDKEVDIINFKKLLVSTLSDVVDAKQARVRMWDIIDAFHWAIDDVLFSNMSAENKIQDIKELGDQLAAEINNLSEKLSHETLISFI